MIEIEKTYLAKCLPKGLKKYPHKEIIDLYIPKECEHSKLRIRKNGDSYVIIKKNLVNENDASTQIEQSIKITKEEFMALSNVSASKIRKIRYNYNGAEIDIFQDKFKGLVLIDVEFANKENLKSFKMPEYCLVEITGDTNFAGGVLCKQKISNLKKILKAYRYKKLI